MAQKDRLNDELLKRRDGAKDRPRAVLRPVVVPLVLEDGGVDVVNVAEELVLRAPVLWRVGVEGEEGGQAHAAEEGEGEGCWGRGEDGPGEAGEVAGDAEGGGDEDGGEG